MIADYDAESAVERELVLRLASVLWRLRRATGIETALFESVSRRTWQVEHGLLRPTLIEAADLADRNQLHLVQHGNLTRRETSSVRYEKGYRQTASCAWPLCRPSLWTASAVTSICSGGKPARL